MTIRLDTRLPARLWLPTRTAGPRRGLRAVSVARPAPARGPYSALLPVGLAVPVRLPVPRWALTPPFHPYPCVPRQRDAGRSVFCGAFPRVAPAGCYPAPLPCGVRTFLVTLRCRGHPALRALGSLRCLRRRGQRGSGGRGRWLLSSNELDACLRSKRSLLQAYESSTR